MPEYRGKRGHYLLSVKDNQATLKQDIAGLWADLREEDMPPQVVTSLSPQQAGPARLLELWRGHRGIENRVFWVRDVTMDEDRCQVRTRSAPQIMAGLRNLIISLFRIGKDPNIAAALRPLRCQTFLSPVSGRCLYPIIERPWPRPWMNLTSSLAIREKPGW